MNEEEMLKIILNTKYDNQKVLDSLFKHQLAVMKYFNLLTLKSQKQIYKHDEDKASDVDGWAKMQALDNSGLKFGTPEHKKFKELLGTKELIDKHTRSSRHHPEFFDNDFFQMNIIDLIEMVIDWYVANTTRVSGDGVSMNKMMQIQIDRFNIEPQLAGIILNTLKLLEDIENE